MTDETKRRVRSIEDLPPADDVADALQTIEDAILHNDDGPRTPPVGAVRTLREWLSLPWLAGRVTVERAAVTRGDPEHGEHSSYDHVSEFIAHFPKECPECGHSGATFEAHRMHNIAGETTFSCRLCGFEHYADQWG